MQHCLSCQKSFFLSPYTFFQNGHHAENTWCKLHKNKGIRTSLGGIRIKRVSQLMLQNNCRFPLLSNLFSLPWNIMQNGIKMALGLMTLFLFNSCQFFSTWWPFWNKVYCVVSKYFCKTLITPIQTIFESLDSSTDQRLSNFEFWSPANFLFTAKQRLYP